ncbi:hypothetical protein GN244_ATG13926 [Phytophthora infestans]|uniref:Uncharacterized protein n=1 Tax=Phytophthora infestans TaxID=4787 RepID=A0A833SYW1_PHYIN|nr:hypothetical protein GN244_ATG13926 [Phytophthora infestans]
MATRRPETLLLQPEDYICAMLAMIFIVPIDVTMKEGLAPAGPGKEVGNMSALHVRPWWLLAEDWEILCKDRCLVVMLSLLLAAHLPKLTKDGKRANVTRLREDIGDGANAVPVEYSLEHGVQRPVRSEGRSVGT